MKQLLIAALFLLAACNTNRTSLDIPFNAYEWALSQVDIALEERHISQNDYEMYLDEVAGVDFIEFDSVEEFMDYIGWIVWGDYGLWDEE